MDSTNQPTQPEQPEGSPPQQPEQATVPPVSAQNAPAAGEDPGKTMGIVGLVLAFVFSPAGLIVSIIARKKSKAAGASNGLATAGIVLSIINLIIGIIVAAVAILATVAVLQKCSELGPGTHYRDGVTYTCS